MSPFPRLLSCFLLVLVAAWSFVGEACADEPIRIGVITDLSGPAAYYGVRTRVGAQMAQKELAAKGERLELVFEDSVLSTQVGLSAAQKLISFDRVDALYVNFTAVATAVAPLAERNSTLMLYSAASESVVAAHSNTFKTYLSYPRGCAALARAFLARGKTKIGVLKAESEFGELCAQSVSTVAPTAFVQSYRLQSDVSAQLLAFKARGVDAIINATFEGDVERMLIAARNLQFRGTFGVTSDSLSLRLHDAHADMLREALVFGSPLVPDEFKNRAMEFNAGEPLGSYEEGAAFAYVHFLQLYRALRACNQRDIDCKRVALETSPPEPLIGFRGWKNRVADLDIVVWGYRDRKMEQVDLPIQ